MVTSFCACGKALPHRASGQGAQRIVCTDCLKERRKIRLRAYYLTHQEEFRKRDKKWRVNHSYQIKVARGLGISVRDAGLIVRGEAPAYR